MIEKRRYQRFDLGLKAMVNEGPGEIVNVSRFGLMASFVSLGIPVCAGDMIGLKIAMPHCDEPVLCQGTVRHVKQKDDARCIGLEIKAMDPSVKSDILELGYQAFKSGV